MNGVQPEIEVEAQPPRNITNDFNPNEIERDPGNKKQFFEYPPNIQDQVRRAYVLKGPMQPDLNKFPRTEFGSSRSSRAFSKSWYKTHPWIEYSEWKKGVCCF